jgi:hypothetical protein
MMTWNYRVFREEDGDYVIREVFYADDGSIITCTADPVEPFGSSFDELAEAIEDFKKALEMPVLTLSDIPSSHPELEQRRNGKRIPLEDVRAELGLADTGERPSSTKSSSQSRKAS